MTQIKRPVQDVGRPIHKSPDLKKVQSIVDQIKNVDFFNLDNDETTKAKCDDFDEPISDLSAGRRPSRNVFDDFSEKMKNSFGDVSKKVKTTFGNSKKTDRAGKKKRTSNDLFNRINISPDVPMSQPDEHHESDSENQNQEAERVEPTEDERLLGDLNTFQSKLNPGQQLDISDFLDHIRDKPKAFKFDTSPFLLAQLEKLTRPITRDQQERTQEDEGSPGARKFFDFNSSPVKRSLYVNQLDDYRKIAKLKSKLVAEYRDHHPMIDYSAILRRIDADKNQRAEQADDFLDRVYQLNDGSSRLDDVMKSHRSDKHVISPYELNLNFQLDNQFKELDTSDFDRDQIKSADVPLQKPELYESDEASDISP